MLVLEVAVSVDKPDTLRRVRTFFLRHTLLVVAVLVDEGGTSSWRREMQRNFRLVLIVLVVAVLMNEGGGVVVCR